MRSPRTSESLGLIRPHQSASTDADSFPKGEAFWVELSQIETYSVFHEINEIRQDFLNNSSFLIPNSSLNQSASTVMMGV